ncbi:hypothetical protein PAHAL_3G419000 [Panicum hallii]|uniref:Uncharacterized protein n=1 Tax=Panicum hallii TaxID=206008 RepID=A0A2S3HE75_9POAL|nr:hypothetical protein PAHAL_3G419000 [Panicum hallii]
MMASHYFSPGMTSLNIDTWTAAVQAVIRRRSSRPCRTTTPRALCGRPQQHQGVKGCQNGRACRHLTTGEAHFAECPRHLAKQQKLSANSLPSVTLGKEEMVKKGSAKASLLSIFCRALSKEFAERLIQHSTKKIDVTAEETVTDICRASGKSTRQGLCSLPSACVGTLGKDYSLCRVSCSSTRQS